jgi:hypothetical protein
MAAGTAQPDRLLAVEIEHVVARHDTQVDVRVLPREARKARNQPRGRKCDRGGHRHSAHRAGHAHRGGVDQAKRLVDRAIQVLPSARELQGTVDPTKQHRALAALPESGLRG